LLLRCQAVPALTRSFRQSLQALPQLRSLAPELFLNLERRDQEIAGIEVALGEGIVGELLQRHRHEIWQPDILPDHDPHILDAASAERQPAQPMAGRDQIGRKGRISPVVVLKLLERPIAIELHRTPLPIRRYIGPHITDMMLRRPCRMCTISTLSSRTR
jgi:hypothetical protein